MTLEEIYFVGQTIAVFAIVGSLVVLIVQMRQANRLARSSAKRDQMEALKGIMQAFSDDPTMIDIWMRGNADPNQLTDIERMRYASHRLSNWRTWEVLHAQYLDGLIDRETWDAHTTQLRSGLRGAGPLQAWTAIKPYFTPSFRTFLEAEIAKASTEAPVEVQEISDGKSGRGDTHK